MTVLLAALPVFVAHLGIQVLSDIRSARERTKLIVEDVAAGALPLLKSTLVVGDLSTAQETLDSIMSNGEFLGLRLYGQEGRALIVEGRAAAPGPSTGVPQWFRRATDFRFDARRFPVVVGGTAYGVLEIEPSPAFVLADVWRRLWTASLVWLLTIAIALLVLKTVLRGSLKPLEELADAANRLGDGDLACRAPVGDVPELAQTARAFNHMADRLVDARARLEERIEDTVRELDSLITRVPAGVYKLRMLAGGGVRFDFVSPRWCELMEVEAAAVYADPRTADFRIHPDDAEGFADLNERAREDQKPFVWEGRLRDGMRVRWLHVESTPSLQENGDILWDGIAYDITASREHQARLDQIAHYDALTGIPNRLLLTDRMKQAIAQTRRSDATLAVCYLDLDGFKPVNDSLGHQAGDTLLVEIAHRLMSSVRAGDTVARIGGDEFVLLLVGLEHIDEYQAALDRILARINQPVRIGPHNVSVSASIGVTLFPADDSDPDILLRHADQAMYRAKQGGRNRLQFFDRASPG